MNVQSQTAVVSSSQLVWRRVAAVTLGTALVAAAAQVTGVIPGTPVPFTLQPLAVLIVGGLLGAAGLPVFTPVGLPGAARLIGPTGGYLLAYPVAAYAVGRLVGDGTRALRVALAALAGLALIHLGGLAQLVILTGSAAQAARLGTLPFVAGDLGKLAIAVLVLRPTVSAFRARL